MMTGSVDWSKGELIIICQAHRRRCYLQPAGEDGGTQPRVRHQGREGAEGDLCVGSQRFWVRREIIASRAELLGAVLADEMEVWR